MLTRTVRCNPTGRPDCILQAPFADGGAGRTLAVGVAGLSKAWDRPPRAAAGCAPAASPRWRPLSLAPTPRSCSAAAAASGCVALAVPCWSRLWRACSGCSGCSTAGCHSKPLYIELLPAVCCPDCNIIPNGRVVVDSLVTRHLGVSTRMCVLGGRSHGRRFVAVGASGASRC
jgi:hypothetical protein